MQRGVLQAEGMPMFKGTEAGNNLLKSGPDPQWAQVL